jgi:zeaxanthin glucosyltransferase
MSHFAVIAPPFPSHYRALEALAERLLARGHVVTFIHQAEAATLLRNPQIGFCAVGEASHPPGSLARVLARAARPGILGVRQVIRDMAAATEMLCREVPAVLQRIGADALLCDQMEAAGGLLGAALQLPFISVACALPVNREAMLPLPVMPWGYAHSPRRESLNASSARIHDRFMRPHAEVVAAQARALGLPARHGLHECLSPLAQISQTVMGFDFPREQLPAHFHHVGPLRAPVKTEPPLALDVKPERPFAFASLGTLQGQRLGLFKRIAEACREQDVQLLLAHCGGLNSQQERTLLGAGASWVTDFAPQRATLERADVAISHAGLNTVMDAFAAGTPLLTLPIAFDQPGVAARVVYAGAGLRLFPQIAGRNAIGIALQRLLREPVFAQRARWLGDELQQAGGVERAVRIIETAVRKGEPVVRGVFS